MEATLTLLTASLAIGFTALLAIVRTGIRRQERATSLTSQPHGFAAVLTRRLCGLRVTGRPAERLAAGDAISLTEDEAEVRSA